MMIMEPGHIMEETSTGNAKISADSGYSNSYSNSQSHTSSGSSASRNSNSSASSGYRGRNPSTFGSCTETSTEALSRSNGEQKLVSEKPNHVSQVAASTANPATGIAHNTLTSTESPCKENHENTAEEVAVVDLVDVTDPSIYNDNNVVPSSEVEHASKTCPMEEYNLQSTEEYYAVISMHDGTVLHATNSLHVALNYPKGSWIGKLFIEFLDPKDKHIFTERVASEIATSKDYRQSGATGRKASIFCRLRRYSFASPKNFLTQQYVPYRITMKIQNFNGDNDTQIQCKNILLVVSFHPIRSAYKVPEETITPKVFTTRHTKTCRLTSIDPDVVHYLGYLPQDMIDRSLFDFYHPEDLPLIKDIYETVIKSDNSSFKSKPYRYITQNGCFVVLETEWSTFINPWTKNLEFVVGQHRILKGPTDPNVFHPCTNRKGSLLADLSVEVLDTAKRIQKEIKALLAEGLCNPVLQEHDSVMLGEISPHHDYFDSTKSSTETPPSYNQLNYHDNIERFFNSNLGINANAGLFGSFEENNRSSANSLDDSDINNVARADWNCTSSTNDSGNSGAVENPSGESNNQQSFADSRRDNLTGIHSAELRRQCFKQPLLTESLLNRHNEDMEKLMVQKHLEQKKGDKRNKSEQKAKLESIPTNGNVSARLKRRRSRSWEGQNNAKIKKHDDLKKDPLENTVTKPVAISGKLAPGVETQANGCKPNVNLWSPISVPIPSTTPINNPCFTNPNGCLQDRLPVFPHMLPIYYLPVPVSWENSPPSAASQDQSGSPPQTNQTPFCYVPVPCMMTAMPGVIYPPLLGATATGASTMYGSCVVPVGVTPPWNGAPGPPASKPPTPYPEGTESRTTSDKAESSSILTLSKSSKKDKTSRSSHNAHKAFGVVRKEPPWKEGVNLTPELVYQYQIVSKSPSEVLKADLDFLRHSKQPNLVNDQLGQLLLDLDIESCGAKLVLDESTANSAGECCSVRPSSPSMIGACNCLVILE